MSLMDLSGLLLTTIPDERFSSLSMSDGNAAPPPLRISLK
jgi:hypothetical protein